MKLKSLFLTDEDGDNKSSEQTSEASSQIKFPVQQATNVVSMPNTDMSAFSTPASTFMPFSQDHLNKALETYQKGFDSLRQAGFGFYELYQAITHGGIDNPQIYTMAYAMGYGMDKTISKDKVLQQADFYINEIQKVYSDYVAKGNAKKQELLTQKNNENQSLSHEVDLIKQQIDALNLQLNDRQSKLSAIEGKYMPMIAEIDSKLAANDSAKTQVVTSIQQVKTGIVNNIK
jgi:hypothetical protein